MINPQGPGVTCERKPDERQPGGLGAGWDPGSRFLLCTHPATSGQFHLTPGKLYSGFGCLCHLAGRKSRV